MKAIRKLVAEADKLEQRFARDIEQLAAELDQLPHARDAAALDDAWRNVTISRRKLSICLKDTLGKIDIGNAANSHERHELRIVQKDLKTATTRLSLWTGVKPVVSAQLLSERRVLIDDGPVSNREPGVLDQVVNLFLQSMHKIANPSAGTQGDAARNHGCHRDIPYPMYWFSQVIGAAHRVCLALRRQRPLRFLDVGSGGGSKVLAAATCFDFCDGLEYDEGAVTTGRRFLELLAPGRCRLIQGDALRFSNYGAYDVIYFYRPMKDARKRVEMEERILSQVTRGTVLLKIGGMGVDILPSRGAHKLADRIYVTGMSEGEVSELAVTAERMGKMIPGFSRDRLSGYGYWRPLLEVSARNGYYIQPGNRAATWRGDSGN